MSTNVQIVQNIEKLKGLPEQWKKHPQSGRKKPALHCHAMKWGKKVSKLQHFRVK